MGFETIKVERHGAVLRIRMNRPDKLNAQNPTLIEEMDAAFTQGAADPDVRVIVLSGEGRAFSAGHDLEYPGYDRRGYTYHTRIEMEAGCPERYADRTGPRQHARCTAIAGGRPQLACIAMIVCDRAHASRIRVFPMLAACSLIGVGDRARKARTLHREAIDARGPTAGPSEQGPVGQRDACGRLASRIGPAAFAGRTSKVHLTRSIHGQRLWEHHPAHVDGKRSEEFDSGSAVEREGGGFKPGRLKRTSAAGKTT